MAWCILQLTFFLGWELHIGPQMLWSHLYVAIILHFENMQCTLHWHSLQYPVYKNQFKLAKVIHSNIFGGYFYTTEALRNKGNLRWETLHFFHCHTNLLRECSNTAGWSQHSCTVLMQTKNWTRLNYPHFFLYCKLKVTELVHTGSCTSAACVLSLIHISEPTRR